MKNLIKILLASIMVVTLSACASQSQEAKTITFYLIRHGETLFNERGLAQGWCDSPLTEEGVEQAEALGEGLKDVDLVAVYSSVSERAMDTANAALKDRDLPLNLSEDLKEMNFGSLEAEPNELLWGEHFKDLEKRLTDGWVDEGGESYAILGERMLNALNVAAEENKNNGGNILISTHGMSILALIQKLDQKAYNDFMATGATGLDNCSVTIVEWNDGEYTVKTINDTSYRDNGMKQE